METKSKVIIGVICVALVLGLIILFVITIMFLAKSSYNPFIYFRF